MTDPAPRDTSLAHVGMILAMVGVVVLPVAATLATIRGPATMENPSPYGYTVSLLIFLIPILAISRWHLSRGRGYDQKAFIWCVVIMAGIGTVLDIAFGYHFFVFPNEAATLGLRVPAWDWSNMTFVRGYLPIEEFGFYILGGIFMATAYLWSEEVWLSDFRRDDYHEAAVDHPQLIKLSGVATSVWAVIFIAGLTYRITTTGGFPGYFVFLMVGGAAPTLLLIRTVRQFVNWHAMAFAFFALLLLSIIWEASIAVPYEWWNYKHDEMLGIFLRGWSDLPIEAVFVWILGVWDAVLIYECLRVFFRMKLRPAHRFRGAPS